MRKNHARFLHVLVALCSIGCIHASQAQSYGEKLDVHWRSILGLEAQDGAYRWFGYPTANFGVMTLYRAPLGRQLTDADRICATWTCIGVDPAKIPTDEYPFTTVKGFAAVGLRSPLELAHHRQGRTAIDLLLSNLLHALSVDGVVDLPETATIDLRASEIYTRTLNLPRFRDFLESSPDPRIQDARSNGELTYIAADIVARGLELTIDADQDPQLAAQLTQAIARLGRNDSSGIRLSHLWRQTYVVKFPEFVVLATQMRHVAAPRRGVAVRPGSASPPLQLQSSAAMAPVPGVDPKTLQASAGE